MLLYVLYVLYCIEWRCISSLLLETLLVLLSVYTVGHNILPGKLNMVFLCDKEEPYFNSSISKRPSAPAL